jgi:hypothetical protein
MNNYNNRDKLIDKINDLISEKRIYSNLNPHICCNLKARGNGYILAWWQSGWEIKEHVRQGDFFCLERYEIFVIGQLKPIQQTLPYIQPFGTELMEVSYPKHSKKLEDVDDDDIIKYKKITNADASRKNRSLYLSQKRPSEWEKYTRKKKNIKSKVKRCKCK